MAQIKNQIRYLTNVDGETTDVLVPIELWQQLISSINSDNASGLAWIDEQEPKATNISRFARVRATSSSRTNFPSFRALGLQ
ncbi:hypothetical protein [Nostoc sp.]|uniref:hypothetical protein n=1 Tax=Nostoc sp. TaxID=1180 RepID=UPI002FF3F1DE